MVRKNQWKVAYALPVGLGRPIEMFTGMKNRVVKAIMDARLCQCNAQALPKRVDDVAIELKIPVDIVTTTQASSKYVWKWFGP